MDLKELRQFAKRMGGGVRVVVTDGDARHEVVDLVAERDRSGETLNIVIDNKEGKDA